MKALVLASSALSPKCVSKLDTLGFETLMMPSYERLQHAVSSHPDMLMFFLDNKYICTKEYYTYAMNVFEKINLLGYSPILTDEIHEKEYPHDVLFNVLHISDKLFALKNAMSASLVSFAEEHHLKIVNTRQGYTKCSVCKISDDAIITADKGISKLATENGIDVLTITSGHVSLKGYDCGFIGGASGVFEDTVYFCGDVTKHPDGEKITEFCEKHEKKCVSLSNEPLFDVGTLFFLRKV